VTAANARSSYDVVESATVYRGRIVAVRSDLVTMPGGTASRRDVIVHPGAVGVVALDEAGRIMMVRQYRHPVARRLWELPAGLLDIPGEPASVAAARELAEEAALRAGRWEVLLDAYSSPGMTDEAYRVFLARDLAEIPPDERYAAHDEEADMRLEWVELDAAVAQVLAGTITNAMAVMGILAAAHARSTAYAALRPVTAPWPARPAHGG
jgi:8-oxo-dGDP phosphatase